MIVITTPTGQIGHNLVEELLSRGESLRLVARDPNRLPKDVLDRVEVIAGSHDNPDVAMRAFEGAEAVFYVVPPNPGVESVRDHYRAFAAASAPAILANGVERVVAVSTLGRGYTDEAGHLSAALEAEPLLQATGVKYRSLGMPAFMDNLLTQASAIKEQGMFFMANSKDRELLTVSTADIAGVAVDLLLDDSWSGQASVPVVSPDHLTPNQMAEVISDVLGRPVRFQQVSPDDYKATLLQYGMSDAWAQGLVDMAIAQNDGIYDRQTRDVDIVTPTTFRSWCETALKPAVLA